jgi:hypothetical protein
MHPNPTGIARAALHFHKKISLVHLQNAHLQQKICTCTAFSVDTHLPNAKHE